MQRCLGKIVGVLLVLFTMGITVCAMGTDEINVKKNQVFQVNSDASLHEQPDEASAITATLPGGTPVIVKEDAKGGWCMVAYQKQSGYVQISILGILGSPFASAAMDQPDATESEILSSEEINIDEGAIPNDSIVPEGESVTSEESKIDDTDSSVGNTQSELELGSEDDGNALVQNADVLDEEFKKVQEQNLLLYQEAEATEKQAASEKMWGIVIAVLVIAIFAVGIITTLVGNKGKKK